MLEDPRITIGTAGERHAETLLRSGGYRILERNFRTREGELDLVVANRSALVFCEVKTRIAGSRRGPTPLEGIGPDKRRQVRRMARRWLSVRESPGTTGIRFDAIGVTVTARGSLVDIEHIEDAFR